MASAPPAVKASVAPAHGMMNDNMPSRSGGALSGGGGQWDRFELKLSKPSGKQKLGMVLKHVINEVVSGGKVKRGAYLASLAKGSSVAQDVGLAPKDRLISVDGVDVKTLEFDSIVLLIRKAAFPLSLVWSRQRKGDSSAQQLPGTVLTPRSSRSLDRRGSGSPRGEGGSSPSLSFPTSHNAASSSPSAAAAASAAATDAPAPAPAPDFTAPPVPSTNGSAALSAAATTIAETTSSGREQQEGGQGGRRPQQEPAEAAKGDGGTGSKMPNTAAGRDCVTGKKDGGINNSASSSTKSPINGTAPAPAAAAATSSSGIGRGGDGCDKGNGVAQRRSSPRAGRAGKGGVSGAVTAGAANRERGKVNGDSGGVAQMNQDHREDGDDDVPATARSEPSDVKAERAREQPIAVDGGSEPAAAAAAAAAAARSGGSGSSSDGCRRDRNRRSSESAGSSTPSTTGHGSAGSSATATATADSALTTPATSVVVVGARSSERRGGRTRRECADDSGAESSGSISGSRATPSAGAATTTQDWESATQRRRAASRVSREMEAQRAPIGDPGLPTRRSNRERQQKSHTVDPKNQSSLGNASDSSSSSSSNAGSSGEHAAVPPAKRRKGEDSNNTGDTGSCGDGTRSRGREANHSPEDLAQQAAETITSTSPVGTEGSPPSTSWERQAAKGQGNKQGGGETRGEGEGAVGSRSSDEAEKEKEKEREKEKRTKAALVRQRRRERDRARREEKKREEAGLDAGARFLERQQGILSNATAAATAQNSNSIIHPNHYPRGVGAGAGMGMGMGMGLVGNNNHNMQPNNHPNAYLRPNQQDHPPGGGGGGLVWGIGGSGIGGGGLRQRKSHGRDPQSWRGGGSAGSSGAGDVGVSGLAAAAAAGGGVGAAAAQGAGGVGAAAPGFPEWLTPLMRATLDGFVGTRYARSRLKQILSQEWAQQEYRTGIAMGQIDRSITEAEFLRRRIPAGSLYGLLAQEAKDYLKPGAHTDAELEQVGTNFARIASNEGANAATTPANPLAAPDPSDATAAAAAAASSTTATSPANNSAPSAYRNPTPGTWIDQIQSFLNDVPQGAPEGDPDITGEGKRALSEREAGTEGGGGDGRDEDVGAWDGQGVDAATVIQHRRRFDQRCTAYESLNSASKVDRTMGLVDRTHRQHREHYSIIAAKRGTLEGTLENVRSQLNVREDQLRLLHMEQRGIGARDPTAAAQLADSEAAIMTRIAEKKLQMMMIMEEANKVMDWERTMDIARREALQHAADAHGHGGATAAEAAQERSALVEAMMSQKATIMLLSTFCKLRGPWLTPASSGYVRGPPHWRDGNRSSSVVHKADGGTAASAGCGGGNPTSPTAAGGTNDAAQGRSVSDPAVSGPASFGVEKPAAGVRAQRNSSGTAGASSEGEAPPGQRSTSEDAEGAAAAAAAAASRHDAGLGAVRPPVAATVAAGSRVGGNNESVGGEEGASEVAATVAVTDAFPGGDRMAVSPAKSTGSPGSGAGGGDKGSAVKKHTIKLRLLPPSANAGDSGGAGGEKSRATKRLRGSSSSSPAASVSPLNVAGGGGKRDESNDGPDIDDRGRSVERRRSGSAGSSSGVAAATRSGGSSRSRCTGSASVDSSAPSLVAAVAAKSPKAGAVMSRGGKEAAMARLAAGRATAAAAAAAAAAATTGSGSDAEAEARSLSKSNKAAMSSNDRSLSPSSCDGESSRGLMRDVSEGGVDGDADAVVAAACADTSSSSG